MADGLLQYSGLVTKTRAMHGRLLTREEMLHLSELEEVEDFIIFLRESKGYAAVYESHEEIHHRGQVEAVIHDSLYADYQKLYQFANGQQRQGLELIFLRYEINILKASLEAAVKGGSQKELGYLSLFFDKHSGYDTKQVTQAHNFAEFINALSATPYETLFLRMNSSDAADCAFALDIYYYKTAWRRKERIRDKKMKQIVTQIIGTEIDWLNIMWIYRSKHFYEMNPNEIEQKTIPIFYRLKSQEYHALLEAESSAQFLSIVQKTAYATEKNPVVSVEDEITFQKVMDRTYEKICRKNPNSIAPVLKYLYDKEREIDVLTSILEGVRYQIPAAEIREMILK